MVRVASLVWVAALFVVWSRPGVAAAGEGAHLRLRATPVAPLDGWVPACTVFEWSRAPDSPAVRYVLRLEQGDAAQIIDVGGATRHEVCLVDGPLTWSVVAFDAEGRSRRTPEIEVAVDGTPPRLDEGTLRIDGRCLPDRVITVAWDHPRDLGSGLAEAPYVVSAGAVVGPHAVSPAIAASQWHFEGLPDALYTFRLAVADRVGNVAVVERAFVLYECRPLPVSRRWSGVVPATATPDAPVETGLVLEGGRAVTVAARGALCFTADRACDPPVEPVPCASPAGPDPGVPVGVPALPEHLFGSLLAQVGDGPFEPVGDHLWAGRDGSVRLAINTAEPSPCQRPGYEVNLLEDASGLGLVWPVEGAVVAEATPSLVWRLASSPARPAPHAVIFVDGVGRFETRDEAQWRLGEALDEGPHTWSLVSIDESDNVSMTPPSTFIVDLSPPEVFEVVEPAAGAAVEGSPVWVCWEAARDVGGVDHYRMGDDAGRVVVVADDGRDRYCAAVELDVGERCVRVEAFDRVGRSTIAERCFAVQAPVDGGMRDEGVDAGGSVEPDAAVDGSGADLGVEGLADAAPVDAAPVDAALLDGGLDGGGGADVAPAEPTPLTDGGLPEPRPSADSQGGADGCTTHRGGGSGGWLVLALIGAVGGGRRWRGARPGDHMRSRMSEMP